MPKVEKEIIVKAPVDTVYEVWHNFENFPRFMSNIEQVRVVGGGRSHWKAKGPLGASAEWDAEMTLDRAGEAIGWRSIEGNSAVKTAGRVNFEDKDGSTRLRMILEYEAPAGALGNVVTKIFSDPERQIAEDLERFKHAVEQGAAMSGLSYGGATRGAPAGAHTPETLGGSLGPVTEADLESVDAMSTPDDAPTMVDDPAVRRTTGADFGESDTDLPEVGDR